MSAKYSSWPAHSVPLSSSYTVKVNLVLKDARVASMLGLNNTTSSLEKEYDVPKKQPSCRICGNKIKVITNAEGEVIDYAHKKREHWLDRPHKAIPETMQTSSPKPERVGA